MPSLPQDSPSAGPGTGFPMVRGSPSELVGFYTTSYEAAFGRRPAGSSQKLEAGRVLGAEPPGRRSPRPLLGPHGGSGYVTNNSSALSSLLFPHLERRDTDVSATSRDFRLFGHPQFQRMLPQHVDEPECPYPAGISLSRLRFGEPQIAVGHPAPFAPPELQVGPKGVTTGKEPLAYGTAHSRYLNELSPLVPVAPGWWTPVTWAPRPVEGIQIPSPSGFSTNNHPTKLWRIDEPPT